MVSAPRTKSTKSFRLDDTILNLLPQAEIDRIAPAPSIRNIRIRGTSANPDTYFQSREATTHGTTRFTTMLNRR
jgi:hypothetical protein